MPAIIAVGYRVNSKRAVLNGRQKSTQLTVGRFAKKRSEADFAFPLIKDKLALRTNAMWEDRAGWFEFESLKAKGLAVARGRRSRRAARNELMPPC